MNITNIFVASHINRFTKHTPLSNHTPIRGYAKNEK